MDILKKLTAIICSGILLSFSGCGTAPRTVSGNMSIAENGIVEQEIFKQLKEENSIAVFGGESNGIRYEWTVFGDDISEPKDLNLAVIFYETDEENSISFEFSSKEELGFRPMLSIYLNESWQSQSASVYSEIDGDLVPVCSASITGNKSNILNFSVSETQGKYIIIADGNNVNGITNDIVYTDNVNTTTATKEISDNDAETVHNGITDSGDTKNNETQHEEGGRIYSDGSAAEQDKYLTDMEQTLLVLLQAFMSFILCYV